MPQPNPATAKLRLKRGIKSAISIIVFAIIAMSAWKLNQQYRLTNAMLTLPFCVSTLLAIIYRMVNPTGWAFVLRGFGYQVSKLDATRVWLHAESRRWLPGGVWGYASRAVQAQELGVPIAVASASMLVELFVTMVAAIVVSLIGVALYWDDLATTVREIPTNSGMTQYQLTISIVTIPILILLALVTRKKLSKKIKSMFEKVAALQGLKLQTRHFTLALSYFVLMACLNGLVNYTLISAVDGTATVPLIAMIAATSIAWAVGFLAFFSPGGIIVREATLAAILLPWLPYELGFSLAVLSRFAQLIAEVTGMFTGFLSKHVAEVVKTFEAIKGTELLTSSATSNAPKRKNL